MKVLIFGGSGLVGRRLSFFLSQRGHEVYVLSRTKRVVQGGPYLVYRLDQLAQILAQMKGPYSLINLAGESIAKRWTKKRKQEILHSRVDLTRQIAAAVQQAERKPDVWINASAVGYYGSSETAVFTEDDGPGEGFLAEVARQWEAAALRGNEWTRVITARFGVILDKEGGALPRMVLPYRFFLGGRVGSGKQWVSWIHIDDVVGMLHHCMIDTSIHGPINVTAPHPVRMDDFGRMIGKVLHRPHWLSVPAWMLRSLLGDMAEILLQGQKVIPQKMNSYGYSFRYPELERALQNLFVPVGFS